MKIYRVVVTEPYEPDYAVTSFHTTEAGAVKQAEEAGYVLGLRDFQTVELEKHELIQD